MIFLKRTSYQFPIPPFSTNTVTRSTSHRRNQYTMSSLILFLLLLSISISLCECRIQPPESNLERKWKGFLHTIERIPAQYKSLNQREKFDVIQELISGFTALRLLYHDNSKGSNLKLKVMRSGIRHKLLGLASNEGETKLKKLGTVEELVAMDYAGAERGPSVHNR